MNFYSLIHNGKIYRKEVVFLDIKTTTKKNIEYSWLKPKYILYNKIQWKLK